MAESNITLTFNGTGISLGISKSREHPGTARLSAIEPKDPETVILVFETPQFSLQPRCQIPVRLLKNFKGLKTLDEDVKEAGFSAESFLPGKYGLPEKQKLMHGSLYSWWLPGAGTSGYFYLEHPEHSEMAIKIGPFPGLVWQQFIVDWKNARWLDTK